MTGGDSLTQDLNVFYNAGDIAWMITATALVLLMIPGVGYGPSHNVDLDTAYANGTGSSTQDSPDANPPSPLSGSRYQRPPSFHFNGSSGATALSSLTHRVCSSATSRISASAIPSALHQWGAARFQT